MWIICQSKSILLFLQCFQQQLKAIAHRAGWSNKGKRQFWIKSMSSSICLHGKKGLSLLWGSLCSPWFVQGHQSINLLSFLLFFFCLGPTAGISCPGSCLNPRLLSVKPILPILPQSPPQDTPSSSPRKEAFWARFANVFSNQIRGSDSRWSSWVSCRDALN